jgi:hypothetical protein
MCVCHLPTLRLFVTALIGTLRKLMPKDSQLRKRFNQGMLVLHLRTSDNNIDAREWFHMTYTNLTTYRAELIPLFEDPCVDRVSRGRCLGLVPLIPLREPKFSIGTWWQKLAHLRDNFALKWELVPYSLCCSRAKVDAFMPANLFVSAAQGSVPFWSGPPSNFRRKRRSAGAHRKRRRGLVGDALMDDDGGEVGVIEDDDGAEESDPGEIEDERIFDEVLEEALFGDDLDDYKRESDEDELEWPDEFDLAEALGISAYDNEAEHVTSAPPQTSF